MKITEEEQQQRKQRIIETAFRLFRKEGIEHVPLSDIAKASGVGNTTIFRYFSNKPQLVFMTLCHLWEQIGKGIADAVDQTPDYGSMTGYQQFRVWLECWRQLYLQSADFVLFSYESKLYLVRNNIQITQEQYNHLMKGIKFRCIGALEKGKADGSIPVERDSEDLFYAIWGAIRGYIVKIVVYRLLCEDGGPWESRYDDLEEGILSSLNAGWTTPDQAEAHRRDMEGKQC